MKRSALSFYWFDMCPEMVGVCVSHSFANARYKVFAFLLEFRPFYVPNSK